MPFEGPLPKEFLTEQERSDLVVLRASRDGIASENGWCRKTFYETADDGHVLARCALGWLEFYDGGCRSRVIAGTYLAPLIKMATGKQGWERVIAYNDRHHRKQHHMVRLFDQAIAALADREMA